MEKIAELLGVSTKTLKRRRIDFQMEDIDAFIVIDDENFAFIMSDIMRLPPNIGQTRMVGALKSRGLKVSRWTVRALLRRLDPIGAALRSLKTI